MQKRVIFLNSQPNLSELDIENKMEALQLQLAEYEKTSRFYYDNAKEYVRRREYSKAGEALWGSINVYLKIISLIISNRPLPTEHREIRRYVRSLSNSLRDPELYEWYKKAEKLHANFYHSFLDEEEFGENFSYSEKLLQKLFYIRSKFKNMLR